MLSPFLRVAFSISLILSLFYANSANALTTTPSPRVDKQQGLIFELTYVNPMFSWVHPKAQIALYENRELLVRRSDEVVNRYILDETAFDDFYDSTLDLVSRKEWGFPPIFDAAQGVFKFFKDGTYQEFYIYAPYAIFFEGDRRTEEAEKNRNELRNWYNFIESLEKGRTGYKKSRSLPLYWEMVTYNYKAYGEYSPLVKRWPLLETPGDAFCKTLSKSDSRRAERLVKDNSSTGVVYKKSYGEGKGVFTLYLSALFPHQKACAGRELVI